MEFYGRLLALSDIFLGKKPLLDIDEYRFSFGEKLILGQKGVLMAQKPGAFHLNYLISVECDRKAANNHLDSHPWRRLYSAPATGRSKDLESKGPPHPPPG
jgi:hypothetical protein